MVVWGAATTLLGWTWSKLVAAAPSLRFVSYEHIDWPWFGCIFGRFVENLRWDRIFFVACTT